MVPDQQLCEWRRWDSNPRPPACKLAAMAAFEAGQENAAVARGDSEAEQNLEAARAAYEVAKEPFHFAQAAFEAAQETLAAYEVAKANLPHPAR